MDFSALLQQVLNFVGTFNISLLVFVFLICFVGEFYLTVPYLLETILLLAGFHLVSGEFTFLQLLILWSAGLAGRQSGTVVLYYLSRAGSVPLSRLYQRFVAKRVRASQANLSEKSLRAKVIHGMSHPTAFTVAVGRLFWLRIPLTMALGVQGKLKELCVGVVIASIIWDGIYITIGVIGGHVVLKPLQMMLYSLIGLTVFYGVTLLLRFLGRRLRLSGARPKA